LGDETEFGRRGPEGDMKAMIRIFLALALAASATVAQAGVYGDDLGKCLVSSTSEADRSLMVKWIFASMSLNAQVSQYARITPTEREDINRQTAALYMRLLTESCRAQTRDAARYEGGAAIGAAFGLLGQIATQGIFNDPAVAAGVNEFEKFYDRKKLEAVIQEK
jgi:hypothetical protein